MEELIQLGCYISSRLSKLRIFLNW